MQELGRSATAVPLRLYHVMNGVLGPSKEQVNLERLTATFLGVEDAMCFAMGFATNAMNTSCFVGNVCLKCSKISQYIADVPYVVKKFGRRVLTGLL